jgi:hypothetical protein
VRKSPDAAPPALRGEAASTRSCATTFHPFTTVHSNPEDGVRLARRSAPPKTAPVPAPTRAPLEFHQALTGYSPTPLVSLPDLAQEIRLNSLLVKDETSRLGLPSFKVLGASWAVYRALSERPGAAPPTRSDVSALRRFFAPLAPLTLIAATDGNHGRAVAHVARMFGFASRILVPGDMAPARIAAIESEGAAVHARHSRQHPPPRPAARPQPSAATCLPHRLPVANHHPSAARRTAAHRHLLRDHRQRRPSHQPAQPTRKAFAAPEPAVLAISCRSGLGDAAARYVAEVGTRELISLHVPGLLDDAAL